jgi:hypothetical protein
MLALFRRKTATGQLAWLDFGYWEILGLIGRAYLAVCILYIPLRKKRWAPVALLVLLTAWNVATRLGLPPVTAVVPYWLWPFDSGELPSVAMAGIVCSSIFVNRDNWNAQTKSTLAVVYAAALFAAGFAFRFLGISKNAATPTWCPVEFGYQRRSVPGDLLSGRRSPMAALGSTSQASGFEYAAHVSAARFVLFQRLLRDAAVDLRMAGRFAIRRVHGLYPAGLFAADEKGNSHAVVEMRARGQ